MAFRRAAPSHRHRPCARTQAARRAASAALGRTRVGYRERRHLPSQTPSLIVPHSPGLGPCGGGAGCTRRRMAAAAQRPVGAGRTGASAATRDGCARLTPCRVPQRRQTAGGVGPDPHCTRGVGGGLTRTLRRVASSRAGTHGGAALGAAAAALPPPSSPSRAQRGPPRIGRESTPPDTLVKDSRPGDAASSSHACVPARA